MNTKPRISVVTTSFNTASVIEKTIRSVISQDYGDYEYIIIDGGSTDGAQEVIGRYIDQIAVFTSEKDRGIYDGMNKGVLAATGDFVIFLNADDIFVDGSVLSDVAEFIVSHPEADVVYGNSEQVQEYGTFTVRPTIAYIGHKMAISHQAAFVRRTLLLDHPFDLKYKYAADFEQLSALYLDGRKFEHFDRTVARVEMRDGATFRHHIESAEEMYSIIEGRGIDIAAERKKIIRHKKMVRAFRSYLPGFVTKPVLRFLAKHYKVL